MLLNYSSRGLLLENEKVLFIEYKIQGEIYYSLPGGTVEVGENLEKCVIREFHEETEIQVSVKSLILLNEFINPQPKAVAEGWKNGIHQIEAIFTVKRSPDEQQVKCPKKLDVGMQGVRWMTPEELEKVTYYPEMPTDWFYAPHRHQEKLYKTQTYG